MERQRFVEAMHDCHEMTEQDFAQLEVKVDDIEENKATQLGDEEEESEQGDNSSSDEEVEAVLYD
jgi:hypothetical protein